MLSHLRKLKHKIFDSLLGEKTLKNTIWLVLERLFTLFLGVFVTASVARHFGPESYGLFNYALAFIALFTAISTLGLDTLTVKALVEKKYPEGTVMYTSLALRILGGFILMLFASIIIRVLEPTDSMLHLLVMISSFVMVVKSLDVIEYWIQSKQKAKLSSSIRMIAYVISSGLKILLVVSGGSLIHYAFIYLIDALIVGFALLVAYFKIREDKSNWKIQINYAKDVLSKSYYLILSGLMITVYMRIDQVMIGSMIASRSELGFYSVAVKIAEMWYFVPLALITSFQPIVFQSKKESEDQYYATLKLLFTIVFWISIGFGLFISLFSKEIIFILYGASYAASADILVISVWAGTFAILGSARSLWLVMENLNRYTLIFTFFGAIINIILNLFLIPLMGGQGAALATLVSQMTVAFFVPLMFKDTRGISLLMLRSVFLEVLWRDV